MKTQSGSTGAGVQTLILTFEVALALLIVVGGFAFPRLLWVEGELRWLQYVVLALVFYLASRATILQDYAKRWGALMKSRSSKYEHFDDRVFVAFIVFMLVLWMATLHATVLNPLVILIFFALSVLFSYDYLRNHPQYPKIPSA